MRFVSKSLYSLTAASLLASASGVWSCSTSPKASLQGAADVAGKVGSQVTGGSVISSIPLGTGLTAASSSSPQASGRDPLDCSAPWTGVAPLQRLTQKQFYFSAATALGTLQMLTDQNLNLPADEYIAAFASNSLSPVTITSIDQFQAVGELLAESAIKSMPAQTATLMPCPPNALSSSCVLQFLRKAGSQLYRRPLTDAEFQAYTKLISPSLVEGDFQGATILALGTMLQSPYFLYRVESGNVAAASQKGSLAPLTDYELASRLSYLLWNSGPDDVLMAAAAAGGLNATAALQAQFQRMFADPRIRQFEDSMFTQLLDVDKRLVNDGLLARQGPDYLHAKAGVQTVNGATINELRNEIVDFADFVLHKDDAKLATLLQAPYTMIKTSGGVLTQIYGVSANPDPTKTTALDATQRAGLLTLPGFQMAHAHLGETALVLRGKTIRTNLLCQALPPPPPGTATVAPLSPNLTTRARFAVHESNASCAGCHTLMDPLGFAFENFDWNGIYRTTDANQPIDATGQIQKTTASNGSFNGAVDLAHKLAQSTDVQQCFATQVLRYAMARQETIDDTCTLNSLQASFKASGGNVATYLQGVVLSDSFRYIRVSP